MIMQILKNNFGRCSELKRATGGVGPNAVNLTDMSSRFVTPLVFAASGCRFYFRFWLPFLVAALHG